MLIVYIIANIVFIIVIILFWSKKLVFPRAHLRKTHSQPETKIKSMGLGLGATVTTESKKQKCVIVL